MSIGQEMGAHKGEGEESRGIAVEAFWTALTTGLDGQQWKGGGEGDLKNPHRHQAIA